MTYYLRIHITSAIFKNWQFSNIYLFKRYFMYADDNAIIINDLENINWYSILQRNYLDSNLIDI